VKKYICAACCAALLLVSCRSVDQGIMTGGADPAGAAASFSGGEQSACLSQRAGKTGTIEQGATSCARVDSLAIGGTTATVSVIQFAYCSSKFMLSAEDSGLTIFLRATDTGAMVSRCSCPFRLVYSLKGAGIEEKRIVYVGISHPELNEPCTVTVKE
jgi:hypothetical protein